MADYLEVDRGKIEVIPHGLKPEGHGLRVLDRGANKSDEVVIGYFARVAAEKGLHLLAEAFCLLAERGRLAAAEVEGCRLYVERRRGVSTADRSAVRDAGHAERFEYVGELDRPGKIAFSNRWT